MMEKITTGGFPMKKQLTAWLLALVMLFSLVGCGAGAPVQDETNLPQQEQQDVQNAPSEDADMPDETAQIDEDASYTTKDDVALYIHTYGHLPDNFITKKDAQALGWPGGSLEPYAPGKCIGGRQPVRQLRRSPARGGRAYLHRMRHRHAGRGFARGQTHRLLKRRPHLLHRRPLRDL
jgi:ribonuclease T1